MGGEGRGGEGRGGEGRGGEGRGGEGRGGEGRGGEGRGGEGRGGEGRGGDPNTPISPGDPNTPLLHSLILAPPNLLSKIFEMGDTMWSAIKLQVYYDSQIKGNR